MTIWGDGDSLPTELRGLLERRAAGERSRAAQHGGEPRFLLRYVSARRFPVSPSAELLLVEAGPDAADQRLLELAKPGDLAVTRDLPLAERLAEAGVIVLSYRGELLSLELVRERRSLRDRAAELRSLGLVPESPRGKSWGARELKAFADAFDRALTQALR